MSKPSYAEVVAERNALREEVKMLKRQLAEKGRVDPLTAPGKPVKYGSDKGWLAGLPAQDRAYMEKKLGVKR